MDNLSNGMRAGTFCSGKAGLAEAGSTVGAIQILPPNSDVNLKYCINGIAYVKAPTDDIAITAAAVQADETTCLYLVCLDSSGTLSTVKGTAVNYDSWVAGDVVLEWPEPTANTCPIGAIRVDCDGATFTAGTTDLGAANITDTYYDFFTIPASPLAY